MFVSHLRKQHWQLVTKCFLCYDMSAFSVYTASFKYWPPTSPLSPQIYGVWMLCLPSTPNVFKRKLLNVIVPGASSTCFLFLLNEVSWEANKNKKNHLKILRIDGACATFWTKLLVINLENDICRYFLLSLCCRNCLKRKIAFVIQRAF